jgi:hypothetical protein
MLLPKARMHPTCPSRSRSLRASAKRVMRHVRPFKILNNLSLDPRYVPPNLPAKFFLAITLILHMNRALSPSPVESTHHDAHKIFVQTYPSHTTTLTHNDTGG